MRHHFFLVLVLIVTAGFCPNVHAATLTDMNTAVEELSGDFSDVADWINGQLSKSTAFGSGGTLQRPADVKSFPGFEIGITGGLAVAVELGKLSSLDTYAISADFLKFPAFFFSPTGMLHGKIGLLHLPGIGKCDLGAGLSAFSMSMQNDFAGEFNQWQLEGRIQPDLPIPLAVSLALGVGNMKGTFTLKNTHVEEIASIQYNGNTYAQNLETTVYMSSDWNVTSYYAKLVVSQNLIFITPYVGLGLQTSTGEVNTVVGANGTLQLDPSLPGPSEQQIIDVQGPSYGTPRSFDFRLLGGMQISFLPFVSLNLSGEYGKDVYAASLGLVVGL
ncbi:hypothetical protein JW933_06610 [candidate division FCPU426 bacterium]|nr:hypothetical protein [candidate division FCPU426 bacterium]